MGDRNDGLWRGYVVILIAALLIALFPFIRQVIPFLQDVGKSYATIVAYTADMQVDSLSTPAIDTAIYADTILTLKEDTVTPEVAVQDLQYDTVDHSATIGLVAFFRDLQALIDDPKRKLKILWFGDSMIEGDLITQDVRNKMQHQFGGSGVGYVPLTSVVNRFRYSVRHEFSPNWLSYHIVKRTEPAFPMNWNGEYFTVPFDSTTVQQGYTKTATSYQGSTIFKKKLAELPRPTLIYGPRTINDSFYLNRPNYVVLQSDSFALSGTNPVNHITLSDSNFSVLDLDFLLKPDQALYGMQFNSAEGIELHNLASRGNSGMVMTGIHSDVFRGMCGETMPSLIVLQYGINASALGMTEYSWYRRAMKRVVRYFKSVFPQTSILVFSMPDRDVNRDGVMQTDSSVYAMNDALFQVAQSTESAYFDLFAKMGGSHSMNTWVEAAPPLANKDYTHFNSKGSKKVADLFMEFLMQEFENFKQKENLQ